MGQQTTSREQGGHTADGNAVGGQAVVGPAQRASLGEEELRVLECLEGAGGGLTARQLESRSGCSHAVLDSALGTLLERKLVSRLNTIIPSYSARVSRAPADGQ